MKKRIFIRMLMWLMAITACQSDATAIGSNNSNMVIDNLDSVFFDLSQAAYQAGAVEFPVYFNSDDTINAVDFSFRFNQSLLVLDTILDVTSGLQSTYFLNPGDSILRFSSYNLSVIPNLTNVVMVRFLISGPSISIPDIYNVDVFLNGFRSSWRVMDATNGTADGLSARLLNVHPVPASDKISIRTAGAREYSLIDCTSGSIVRNGSFVGSENATIDVSSLPSGNYGLKILSAEGISYKRLIVVH